MRIKKLRDKKAGLVKESRAILDKVAAEDRARSDAEKARQEAIKAEIRELDAEIASEEEQLEYERENAPEERRATASLTPEQRRAVSPEKGEKFDNFGEFLMAVANAAAPDGGGRPDPRLRWENPSKSAVAASGLNEAAGSDGGFLVMRDFSAEILRRSYEIGAVSSRVRRIPISAGANGLKINAIDETSRADGSRWGGVRTFWTAEAQALTGSRPKFRQIELELRKLTGLVYCTDEVLADAAALESIVSQALPEEINFRVEDAIINGSGSGQPLGYMNSGAVITVSADTGQPTKTITYSNVLNMWSRMWAKSRSNAVWLINQDCEPQLFSMSQAIGTGGVPVYLPAGGISGSPYSTLFGRPVIPVEYASTLGTVGDIQLVDLSQYLCIDKGSIRQDVSMHVRFLWDELVYRFMYRIDGQPVWNAPLTPKNGSNTLSPFIVLATR